MKLTDKLGQEKAVAVAEFLLERTGMDKGLAVALVPYYDAGVIEIARELGLVIK
jgi:hypothetical protein